MMIIISVVYISSCDDTNSLCGPVLARLYICRVATVREKYLENDFFSRSGKSQGILWMARQGKFRQDLESQGI